MGASPLLIRPYLPEPDLGRTCLSWREHANSRSAPNAELPTTWRFVDRYFDMWNLAAIDSCVIRLTKMLHVDDIFADFPTYPPIAPGRFSPRYA
jgi:hypothetical protein